MAQLLVRDLESSLVRQLRSRAVALGVSVEEAHRRLLREVLLPNVPSPSSNFIEYLRGAPKSDAIDFPRDTDLPREVTF